MPQERDVNIGILAVQAGLITSAQLAEAIEEVKHSKGKGEDITLRDVLSRKGFLTDEQADELTQRVDKTNIPKNGVVDDGTVKMTLEGDVLYSDDLGGKLLGGDFKIVKKLGSGGMGAVYLAEQVSLQRRVALKMISPEAAADEEYVARFKREAMSAAQLVHPNIVQVHSIGEHQGMWYIAMECVEGNSVGDMLKEQSPMDVTIAANYIAQALKGLARAHSLGIIHRDIKPDNLMVSENGEVKIADFGLARMNTSQEVSLTMSGAVMGTPHYMSPQQAEGKELNQQADIYSLGATFYHMVTGVTPFTGDSAMSILYKAGTAKAQAPHKRNAQIPLELSRLIEKMMARDLAVRYATCEDVLRDLNELGYLGETPAEVRRRQSIPLIAGVAAVVLIIGVLGVYLVFLNQRGKPGREAKPAPLPSKTQAHGPGSETTTGKGRPKPGKKHDGQPDKVAGELGSKLKPAAPPSEPKPAQVEPKPGRGAPRPKSDVAVLPAPKSKPLAKVEPTKPVAPSKPSPIKAPVLPALPQAKRVITVKAGGGGDFATLAEAVASLPAEIKEPVRIDVHPGVYQGPIKIGGDTGVLATKKGGIHVRAVEEGPVVLKAGAEKSMMLINRTDFVTVEGIIFQGSGGSRGINILRSSFFRIRRCVFADCEEGVYSYTASSVQEKGYWAEFSDCLFVGNQYAMVLNDATEIMIRNNVFVSNAKAAIRLYRFRGNILLNIFSIPQGGCAVLVEGGQKLTGSSTFSTKMNYNCYAGKGAIYSSGPVQITEMDRWRLRYKTFDERSFRGEPNFKDPKAGDFRLSDRSKCRTNLPEGTPMGARWGPKQWQTYLAWWKGRKK
ncbi:MAG: protein kinase [Planctomycetes bacterium]|nr:protein kinase [Planctomycetota bacterium]